MEKLLLHVCCGPCAVGSIPRIDDWDVTLYFANSNMNSEEEFEKRLVGAKTVAEYYNCNIEKEPYNHTQWATAIKGLEDEPEKGGRCLKCYEYSFRDTAKKAKELGFGYFTSTLTISPHKNSTKIIEIGQRVASEFGLEYVNVDFCKKNGYKLSVDLSKELDLYRQNYCGCEYSMWWKNKK